MKTLSFELTMPNKGSWNGKWTGDEKKYFIVRKFDNKTAENIMEGAETFPIYEGFFTRVKTGNTPLRKNYYYSWNDGWGANICVEQVCAIEAAKRRKSSSGFWGYDWMVNSIIRYGEILDSNQVKGMLLYNGSLTK